MVRRTFMLALDVDPDEDSVSVAKGIEDAVGGEGVTVIVVTSPEYVESHRMAHIRAWTTPQAAERLLGGEES